MPIEFWIIGSGLIVLAISIWRIAVWFTRNPGRVTWPVLSVRYRRVQRVRLVLLCVVLSALVAVSFVLRDGPFWFVFVAVFVAMSIAELGYRAILGRMWRCPSCGQALPTKTRRTGTSPAHTAQCPSCGYRLTFMNPCRRPG